MQLNQLNVLGPTDFELHTGYSNLKFQSFKKRSVRQETYKCFLGRPCSQFNHETSSFLKKKAYISFPISFILQPENLLYNWFVEKTCNTETILCI